jgi:hypothetical protein
LLSSHICTMPSFRGDLRSGDFSSSINPSGPFLVSHALQLDPLLHASLAAASF